MHFTVCTDNNPLTCVLYTTKLNAVGDGWFAALSTYDFDVHYRPGKHIIDADTVTRNFDKNTEWEIIPEAAFKFICKRVQMSETPECPTRCVDQNGVSPAGVPDIYAFPLTMELQSLEYISKADLAQAQKENPVIDPAVHSVQQNPSCLPNEETELKWSSKNNPPRSHHSSGQHVRLPVPEGG